MRISNPDDYESRVVGSIFSSGELGQGISKYARPTQSDSKNAPLIVTGVKDRSPVFAPLPAATKTISGRGGAKGFAKALDVTGLMLGGQDVLGSATMIGRSSPVWDATSKGLGRANIGLTLLGNGVEAISDLRRGKDPDRTLNKAIGKTAVELAGPAAATAVGAGIGSFIPIPGVGTALGAAAGLSWGLYDNANGVSDKAGDRYADYWDMYREGVKQNPYMAPDY